MTEVHIDLHVYLIEQMGTIATFERDSKTTVRTFYCSVFTYAKKFLRKCHEPEPPFLVPTCGSISLNTPAYIQRLSNRDSVVYQNEDLPTLHVFIGRLLRTVAI